MGGRSCQKNEKSADVRRSGEKKSIPENIISDDILELKSVL